MIRAAASAIAVFAVLLLVTASAENAGSRDRESFKTIFENMLESGATFNRGSLNRNLIALTFDGSWKCETAEPILEILSRKNVKATFFLTGVFLEKYPELAKRISDEGHDVGNHTFSHKRLVSPGGRTRVSREFFDDQLNRTHRLYYEITGRKFAPYWRAPYGAHNEQVRRWASELGYLHVGWTQVGSMSMDTLDWIGSPGNKMYRSADEIARRVVDFGNGRPEGASGAIILMHLGSYRTHDFPHERLGWIIDQMRQKGYEFVTITDMLRYSQ